MYARVYCYVLIYLFPWFSRGNRLEMTTTSDTEDSQVLSPKRNLEEEYLTYEAKVICEFEWFWNCWLVHLHLFKLFLPYWKKCTFILDWFIFFNSVASIHRNTLSLSYCRLFYSCLGVFCTNFFACSILCCLLSVWPSISVACCMLHCPWFSMFSCFRLLPLSV